MKKLLLLVTLFILLISILASSSPHLINGPVTENIKVQNEVATIYETSDGITKEVLDFANPKYKDSNGNYVPVDNQFRSITDKDGMNIGVETGIYKIDFSSDINSNDYLQFNSPNDAQKINMSLPQIFFNDTKNFNELKKNSPIINVIDNNFSLTQLYDGVNVKYSYNVYSFQEVITLTDSSSWDKFVEESNDNNKSLVFDWTYSSSKSVRDSFDKPEILDRNKNLLPNGGYVYFTDKSGVNHVQLIIPYYLLNDKTLPITIDPTLVIATSGTSGVVNANQIVINGTITVTAYNGNSTTGWLWLNATNNITCGSAGCTIKAGSLSAGNAATGFLGGAGGAAGGNPGMNGTGYNGSIYGSIPTNFTFCYSTGGPAFTDQIEVSGSASVISNGSGGRDYNTSSAVSDQRYGSVGYTGYSNNTNLTIYMGCGGGGGGSLGAGTAGNGGTGGGSIKLTSDSLINISGATLDVSGNFGTRGSHASSYPGSGAGGSSGNIYINTSILNINGTIMNAHGGGGTAQQTNCGSGCSMDSAAGAGGYIFLSYLTLINSSQSTNISGGASEGGGNGNFPLSFFGPTGLLRFFNWGGNVDTDIVSPNNGTLQPQTVNFTCKAVDDRNILTNISIDVYDSSSNLVFNVTNNLTGSTNITSFYLEFNQSGDYTYTCKGINSFQNFGWSRANATVTVDAFNPTISLTSPSNGTWSTSGSDASFKCSITGTNLGSLTFWNNFSGTWHLNQTKTSLFSGNVYTFKSNISEGSYVWNCAGNKTSNSTLFYGATYENFTYGVDTTNPLLLIGPSVNASVGSQTFLFDFNVSDNNLGNCKYTLYNNVTGLVDGVSSNITTSCNTEGTAIASGYGNFTLRVYGFDLAGNYNTSTITFNLNTTLVNTGGGSSSTSSPEELAQGPVGYCGDGICDSTLSENGISCARDCLSLQNFSFNNVVGKLTVLKAVGVAVLLAGLTLIFVRDRKRRKQKAINNDIAIR